MNLGGLLETLSPKVCVKITVIRKLMSDNKTPLIDTIEGSAFNILNNGHYNEIIWNTKVNHIDIECGNEDFDDTLLIFGKKDNWNRSNKITDHVLDLKAKENY